MQGRGHMLVFLLLGSWGPSGIICYRLETMCQAGEDLTLGQFQGPLDLSYPSWSREYKSEPKGHGCFKSDCMCLPFLLMPGR